MGLWTGWAAFEAKGQGTRIEFGHEITKHPNPLSTHAAIVTVGKSSSLWSEWIIGHNLINPKKEARGRCENVTTGIKLFMGPFVNMRL